MRNQPGSHGGRFEAEHVVERYTTESGLTTAERRLLDRWGTPGRATLDLGVGAGRTVPDLLALGGTYVGIDLAPSMIDAARERHPEVDLRVLDAKDLSAFADESFGLVLWSYNGLDYLSVPDRASSLRECHRVMVDDGVLLVSSHDPRAVVVRPSTLPGRTVRRYAVAALMTVRRLGRAAASPALWRGRGMVREPLWDGLQTYAVTPARMAEELAAVGLRVVDREPGDAPQPAQPGRTTFWYYAAVPSDGPGVTPNAE